MEEQIDKEKSIKTVLVIEDEVPLQDAICLKLEKEGLRYLPAFSAEDGLKILEKEKPNLVWLDLLLPGMGGFAFLEQIRKDERFRNMPVVVVSVSASPEKIRRAFELNVVDYLVKSQYQLNDIVRRVQVFLGKEPSSESPISASEKLSDLQDK